MTVNSVEGQGINAPVVTWTTTFTLSLNPGTGPLNGTLIGTILAGTSSITVSGLSLDTAQTGVMLKATVTAGDTLAPGNSAAFSVIAGTATHLVITGSAMQTAGTTQNLTITAYDGFGNIDQSYTGGKSLTFSGANPSTSPVIPPTVTNSGGVATNFGTATSITFASGVAHVSSGSNGVMALYKVETPTIAATDGSIALQGPTA